MFRLRAALLLIGFPVLLLLSASCDKQGARQVSVDDAMKQAMKYYNRGRTVDALDRFSRMSLDYAGSALRDSINYMEAECQYQLGEYILAADLFETLINRYPTSPLVDNARFRAADCYYELSPRYALEQSFTYRAIEEYQALLDEYPDSEFRDLAEERLDLCRHKLALKDYKSAELYYRMSLWPAALLYLNEILETWYDQEEIMEQAHYLKGVCQAKMKRWADARASITEFLAAYPESRLRPLAEAQLDALQ